MHASGPSPRLITFGSLALLDATGEDLVSPESTKLLALLAYLAAAPGRRATRERLIDFFWRDSPVTKARNALRQSIHKLRDILGEGFITSGSADDVLLSADLRSDRDDFLAAIERNDLESAVAIYTGPFAPDVLSAGTADFEQWADQERLHLHEFFGSAVETVARQKLQRGDTGYVRALADRLLCADGCDERAWRLRIEAEAASGSRVHLAASIAEIERRFAQENRTIKPQTRQLIQMLSRTAGPDDGDDAGPGLVADLVGRHDEFARLHGAWRDATSRHPSHLHLVAPAGLGKTRLLEDYALRLRGERARVVLVRATPRQRGLPGSFLATLIGALADIPGARGISRRSAQILVDVQPAVEGRFVTSPVREEIRQEDRQLLRSSALADLLKALADEGPTCLLLDDLHWWDQHSRDVVAHAIDRLSESQILVVTASRPGAMELSTSLSVPRIELTPLTVDQIDVMLGSLGESDDPLAMQRLARALHQAADGVPLLILEALRLGLDRGALGFDAGEWRFHSLDDYIASLRPGAALRDRVSALTESQRKALLLAAIMEQPVDDADIAALGVDGAAPVLLELEHLGMLAQEGDGWIVAHDLIAEVVIEASTPEELKRIRGVAGNLLVRNASSAAEYREAIQQFAAANDIAAIASCCATWIEHRRADGDRRPGRVIANDLLRDAVGALMIGAAVAALPSSLRRRPVRMGLVAGAVCVLTIAVTAAWWERPVPQAPDATIGFFVGPTDSMQQLAVPLALSTWSRVQGVLRPVLASKLAGHFPGRRNSTMGGPVAAPDGHAWLVALADTGRLGPTELDIVDQSGSERALAPAPGDDATPDWSPDSRYAVLSTTRWTVPTDATFQLGVVDIANGSVRQLTNGPASDEEPKWSPDGTRIAFRRMPAELAPDEICWISTDGRRQRCQSITQGVERLVGWTSQHNVLANLAAGNGTTLAEVDVDDGVVTPIVAGRALDALLSPSGDWIVCSCSLPEAPDTEVVMAFPLHQPESYHEIRGVKLTPYWLAGAARPSLARVQISPPGEPVPLDGSYRLSVVGRSSNGGRMDPVPDVLSWLSADTMVAGVDTLTGDVYPHHPGSTWVFVSAGGWVRDSVLISIGGPAATTLFTEAWTDSWPDRWATGGPEPLPSVVESRAAGRGFTPNGNGTYADTAATRVNYPSDAGLGVEAIVQTPVTRTKWQNVGVYLVDRSSAPAGEAAIGCGAQYPNGEGWTLSRYLRVPGGATQAPEGLTTGKPFRLRVQLFPDGSCGVAIDGRPVSRLAGVTQVGHPMGILLRGQSVGAHMMVGRLTLWRGVRRDVDWAALGRDGPTSQAPKP